MLRADRRYATLSIQDVYRQPRLQEIAARMGQLRRSIRHRPMQDGLAIRPTSVRRGAPCPGRGGGFAAPCRRPSSPADAPAHRLVALPVLRLSLFHGRRGRQHPSGGSLFRAGLPVGRGRLVPRGHRRQVAGGGAAEARPLSALGRDLLSLVAGRPPLRVAAARSAQRNAAAVLVPAGLGGEDRQRRDHRFGPRASARSAARSTSAQAWARPSTSAMRASSRACSCWARCAWAARRRSIPMPSCRAIRRWATTPGWAAFPPCPPGRTFPTARTGRDRPRGACNRPIEALPPRPRVGRLARLAQSAFFVVAGLAVAAMFFMTVFPGFMLIDWVDANSWNLFEEGNQTSLFAGLLVSTSS